MLVAAVYAQREATLSRVAALPDADWELRCPDPPSPPGVVCLEPPVRRIRDLVAHLIAVDEMVVGGGAVRSWLNLRRLGGSGAWDPRTIDPLTRRTVAELLTLLARRGEQFAQLASAAPAAVGHLPLRGPLGRWPLLHVIARRVAHEWLHDRDIAAAQGVTPPDPHGAVGDVVASAVLAGLPATTLPGLRLRGGVVRLVIDVDPSRSGAPQRQRAWSVDFTRRQYGTRVAAGPDATVEMTATALGLLAARRATAADPILGIRVEGEQELATALLDAITMLPSHGETVPTSDALTAP